MQYKNWIHKNQIYIYLFLVTFIFTGFISKYNQPKVNIKPIMNHQLTNYEKLARENQELRNRLSILEPATPVKIVNNDTPPKGEESIQSVIANGSPIPFSKVYQDANWIRPDFEPYWHSKTGQGVSISDRIDSAYHHLFVTPATDVLWKETMNECGMTELSNKIKLPLYSKNPQDTIVVVALQYNITDAVLLNNQLVLMGTPVRTGVQVISFNKQDLISSISGELVDLNQNQEYLFHLCTPDGYEIDYKSAFVNF